MEKIEIYFKSDFTVILASEAQWGGCPFRLNFYTASPSRSFVACYDGENYHNCRLLEDGRLEVAINQKDGNVQALMGIGTLTVAPEFYLDNDAFRDHVCNQFVKPFVPTFEDEEGNEYQVNLSLNGVSTLVTYGTLPAYYQKGDKGEAGPVGPQGEKGEQGLPGRDADIAAAEAATERANTAATKANQSAENANTTASQVREEYDEWLQEQDVEIASAINIVKDAGQAQIVACEAAEESANNAALNATNEAAKIAPAISSMQSTFDAQEAARQRSATDQRAAEAAEFASKEAQRDAAIEEATKVSSKVDTLDLKVGEINATLGQYAERASVLLEVGMDNMAIDAATGKPVVKSGWAISKPFTIQRGNEYLVKVGQTDGTVWAAAEQSIYEWDEVIVDEETGEETIVHHTDISYSKKVHLNAGAELPLDGYLRILGMPNDFDIVVSYHKASADATIKVRRDGLTANICTQVGNQESEQSDALNELDERASEAANAKRDSIDVVNDYLANGYPTTLYGHGTPSSSVLPINLPNHLPWSGTPEHIAQRYIDVDVTSDGLYYAKPTLDIFGYITAYTWAQA